MFSASSEGDSVKHNNGFLRLPGTFRDVTTNVVPHDYITDALNPRLKGQYHEKTFNFLYRLY